MRRLLFGTFSQSLPTFLAFGCVAAPVVIVGTPCEMMLGVAGEVDYHEAEVAPS